MARNPIQTGGATAFFVSLAFVSANALWYQPQVHPSAFVSTRAPAMGAIPEPQVAQEPPHPQAAPRPQAHAATSHSEAFAEPAPEATGSVTQSGGDAKVRAVQKVLGDLGLYRGPVDGLTGPQTRQAVENYRRIVGLDAGSQIDGPLLQQLGLEGAAMAGKPAPKPAQRDAQHDGEVHTASVGKGDPMIERVQAGLKAFGNDAIAVDGVMGESTRKAIREFQSLFGLPVTGEPDAAFLAKMREIGLTN